MSDIDLSILIPTRNRPALAKLAAIDALAAAGKDDEVIIADNGDEPLRLDIDDHRLKVIRANRVLSMPQNWESALRASRGAWVILLADKFRIVPNVFSRLRQSIPAGLKVATYSRPAFWQSLEGSEGLDWQRLASAPGTLVRSDAPMHAACADAQESLRRWFHSVQYLTDLPMLYTALVHRDVIHEAYARGPFFLGNSPDVASSLQILSHVDSYWSTNLPAVLVQIPGDPLKWSNGASNLVGGDLAKQFAQEFGESPFARAGLPPGLSTGVFEVLLAYRKIHPQAPEPSWRKLASQVTREIEAHRTNGKTRQHLRLLRATQSTRLRPSAALEQARMIAILRTYRTLSRFAPSLPKLIWRMKKLDTLDRRSVEANVGAAVRKLESELEA